MVATAMETLYLLSFSALVVICVVLFTLELRLRPAYGKSKPSSAHQTSVASNSTQQSPTQSQIQKKNDKDNFQAHAVVTVPSSFRPKVSFASMAKVLTTLPQQYAFQ